MASSESKGDGRRFDHLDTFRILSVSCVVWAHNSDAYIVTNSVYGQNWGLQILLIICGILWSMSRTPPLLYAARLFVFFWLGVFSNWLAYVATGADWRSNLWDVVYQMWFVWGLLFCILSTAPLKWALNNRGNTLWKATAGYGVAAAIVLVVYLFGLWTRMFTHLLVTYGGSGGLYYSRYTDYLGFYQCQFWCVFALTALACSCILHSSKGPQSEAEPRSTLFLAWWILLCTYIPSIFLYEPLGAWVHDFFLFLLGLLVQRFSMFGQSTLACIISSYWPLAIIMPIGGLNIPYVPIRRVDIFPLHDLLGRARFAGMELVFVLAFVTCGTPAEPLQRKVPVPFCSDPYDVLGWLNRWALFAYMCHMAFLRLLPEPFNWLTVYLSAGVFFAEDAVLRKLGKSTAPEIFGCAWLVFAFPYLLWLKGSFSYFALSCILGYVAMIIAMNMLYHRKKGVVAREYAACNAFPDGMTPLTRSEHPL